MTGRIRRLVKIYDTGGNVRFEVSLQGRAAIGDGREVSGANEYCKIISGILTKLPIRLTIVVVLKQQRP